VRVIAAVPPQITLEHPSELVKDKMKTLPLTLFALAAIYSATQIPTFPATATGQTSQTVQDAAR
jgi:hypothetical protein